MDINAYLLASVILAFAVIIYLLSILRRVHAQLSCIQEVLEDIKKGNLNRRILTTENDMTKQICYDINEIVVGSQKQRIRQEQSEHAYKRLMRSLSHDVKTPLASLIGYLEAIEYRIVTGTEKDEYIHIAYEKTQHLKHFVAELFEWVTLASGEQVFHFELLDVNELSRVIAADWIPVLENSRIAFEFEIPETEYLMRIDATAYTRILNNLLQNIITHSGGDRMTLRISEDAHYAKMVITDNGKGIPPDDLLHIFERMYRCDRSRTAKGSGLGLAITKELVEAHKGTITVSSIPEAETAFTVQLPKIP